MTLRPGVLARLAARLEAERRDDGPDEAPPVDPVICRCARPGRDRCYFGTWVCRLCGQPIVPPLRRRGPA